MTLERRVSMFLVTAAVTLDTMSSTKADGITGSPRLVTLVTSNRLGILPQLCEPPAEDFLALENLCFLAGVDAKLF